ncbi:Leucine-rich PPR motif-containing protein, mitochondrial [Portunus trituberculatus]|uniref:Leucine-rich PPR motif-containing protein, mitochondrial n=1 Tax=Portunus trituberculatus TaxID=210409 RepID=A0A5B7FSX0_PORTR|nr:Leucine-rich PPR motif-containing protein, mitochondrial [Portunus trituberculatus]
MSSHAGLTHTIARVERECWRHCGADWLRACGRRDSVARLQKIMDLSIQVHGELNSLYDMVFAFVECGKVQQARKLVEVSGLACL